MRNRAIRRLVEPRAEGEAVKFEVSAELDELLSTLVDWAAPATS